MFRRRIRQTEALSVRVSRRAQELHSRAFALPPGSERDSLIADAEHCEAAMHMEGWLMSRELMPPTNEGPRVPDARD